MIGGRSAAVGFQFLSCKRFSSLSGPVTESFTMTIPGLLHENVKWCMALMPLQGCWFEGNVKKLSPVISRYHHLTILCAYKLSMVNYCGFLDDVFKAPIGQNTNRVKISCVQRSGMITLWSHSGQPGLATQGTA